MTVTALCEKFIDKNTCVKVIELYPTSDYDVLFDSESVYMLEYSNIALYSIKYIDFRENILCIYVMKPNDGFKKVDF